MRKAIFAALGLALLLSAVPLGASTPVLAWHRHGWGGWYGGWWGPRWGWGRGWGGWYDPYWGPYGGYYAAGPGPGWAAIDTDVSPEQARVFLDGQYIGTADDFDGYPDYLYLRRGRYRLEFRLEGYETKPVELTARPGMLLDIDDKLRKIPGSKQYGSYEIEKPPGGVHRFYGKRSDGSGAAQLRDDRYEVAPEGEMPSAPPEEGAESEDRPGRPAEEWREQPSGSGSVAVRPQRSSEPARLAIRAEPGDAAVYLDDRFVGTAEQVAAEPLGLKVAPGRHSLTVSRPGYKDRTVEVEVESGQSESVEIALER
ncbi:MAG: PEGA domain-containing protein [Thermoanaerobaculia bacterium]